MSSVDTPSIPDHVPPHLVIDLDIYDVPGGTADPQAAWRVVQGKGPLVYTPRNGGHWIATEAGDIAKFYRDFAQLSSRKVVIPEPGGVPLLPIQADPPLHRFYRGAVNPMFSPQAAQRLSGQIRQTIATLIADFRDDGSCEFMGQFAVKFPLMIFLDIMGLPLDDLLYLRRIVDTYASHPDVAVKQEANAELSAYLTRWIEKRIAQPGDDGLTLVTRGEVDGRPFTMEEMLSTCVNLMQAGLDTVMNLLGFIMAYLGGRPDQCEYIKVNGDRMDAIAQELIRRFPIANMAREVAQDWEHKGVLMKAGDRMYLPTSLFNLDAGVAANPDAVDFERPARHISFGSGRHTCAGAVLARKELAIFLDEWFRHIPEFRLDPQRPPRFKAGAINAACEVWLTWPVNAE